MKIKEILAQEKPVLSFEVFPPKQEDAYEAVEHAVTEIAKLSPSFMSVTYGAGGGTSRYTAKIASGLLKNYGVTALAHLSCVTSTKDQVRAAAGTLKTLGIENILALRGDIPADGRIETDYHYACELVRDLKQMGDFCIGGACYPEGHPESPGKEQDILYLKEKVEAGKRIGIGLTDGFLMTPSKSVTAVIGVSRTPQQCVPEGCVSCGKKDCLFRR